VDPSVKLDGFVETYRGLDEIILGVQTLSHFEATMDYLLENSQPSSLSVTVS